MWILLFRSNDCSVCLFLIYVLLAVEPCSFSPCVSGGTCLDLMTWYTCSCLFVCFYIFLAAEPCSSSPCINDGTCLDLVTQYTCQCMVGWTGVNCEMRKYCLIILLSYIVTWELGLVAKFLCSAWLGRTAVAGRRHRGTGLVKLFN